MIDVDDAFYMNEGLSGALACLFSSLAETGGAYGPIEASIWVEKLSECRERNGGAILVVAVRLCNGGWMEWNHSCTQQQARRTGSSWMRY